MSNFTEDELQRGQNLVDKLIRRKGKLYGILVTRVALAMAKIHDVPNLSEQDKKTLLESMAALSALELGFNGEVMLPEVMQDAEKFFTMGMQAAEAATEREIQQNVGSIVAGNETRN